jgi:hypothetical protein
LAGRRQEWKNIGKSTTTFAVRFKFKTGSGLRLHLQACAGRWKISTDGFLEIHVQLFLYLSSKTSSAPRDRYWAPIDLFRDGPLSVDKQPMDKEGEVLAIKRFPSNSRSTRKVSQLISALMPDKFFGIEKSVQFGLHENYLLLSSQEATISAGSGNKER